MRDILMVERIFASKRHQLTMFRCGQNGLGEMRYRIEGRCQINVLKRAGAEHLGLYLPSQRKDGRAVDLSIPHARQQVGCARACNRQTRCRMARQFAIGRSGESRRAFMANADKGHLTIQRAAADRICQTEIGMTDHAEHALYAPVHHSLCHHIRCSSFVRWFWLKTNKNLLAANFDGIHRLPRILMSARRFARERIKIPTMPWTPNPALFINAALNRTLAQRPPLMRAVIVHRRPLAIKMCQTYRCCSSRHCFNSAIGKVADRSNLNPFKSIFAHFKFPISSTQRRHKKRR